MKAAARCLVVVVLALLIVVARPLVASPQSAPTVAAGVTGDGAAGDASSDEGAAGDADTPADDESADDATDVPTRDHATDPLLAPVTACPGQMLGAAASPSTRAKRERALVCLINYARRRRSLPSVRTNPRLGATASARTRRMARCRSYSHAPCGDGPLVQLRGAGYGRGRIIDAAEDLAWGYADADDRPRDAVLAWLRSAGHRRALLDRRFREVGTSIRAASLDGDEGVFVVAELARTR